MRRAKERARSRAGSIRRWLFRAILVAVALAIGLSLGANKASADPPRMGAALRLVATGSLAPEAIGGDAGRVLVSVRIAGGAEALSSRGFGARGAGPKTAFVEAAPSEIAALSRMPGVESIEPARLLFPTLDRSGTAAGATLARTTFGVDGTGVVVGIVDTGVDFRHADFRTAQGKTRIAALLDLSAERGTLHPETPDYGKGALWLAADLDAQLAADDAMQKPDVPVTERDTNGHGTHVAGIAGGNGLGTGNGFPARRYVGMAPGASLVVAKAARAGAGFSEPDLLTAIRFVFDRAQAMNAPAVVNLSLGGEGGPHDGTTNLERALDDLLPDGTPGRALVVSAGNDGSRDLHAGGFSFEGEGGPVSLSLQVPSNAPKSEPLAIEMWFDGPPPPITVVRPDGSSFGPVYFGARLDESAPDKSGHASVDPAGNIVVDNASSHAPDPINHRYDAGLYVSGTNGKALAAGKWTVILGAAAMPATPVGRWDAWLTGVDPAASQPRFTTHLDEDSRASYPAFARSVIAVGAFVSRTGWPTADGREVTRGTVLLRPSSFSGTGPSLDERFLPDLAAPGDFILSALSIDAPPTSADSVFNLPDDPGFLVADDGVHAALRGTSQAAPHVTGAIALLFQIDPTLTASRLRELLRTSAIVDRGAPGYSTRIGFGRLDVAQAAALLVKRPVGAVDAAVSSVGTSRDAVLPGAPRVTISVVPRDSTGAPLGPGHRVSIESDAGTFATSVTDAGAGRYERVLVASSARGSVAAITAVVDGVTLASHPRVWFVKSRDEVGRPFTLTGGCALSGVGHAPPLLFLTALVLAVAIGLLRSRRRRRA